MRRSSYAVAIVVVASFSASISVRAQTCSSEVQTAFEKQRAQAGYRLISRQQVEGGEIETQRDYLTPDRMYNKIIVPGQPAPLETIAIGKWAWANQGGGWQELQPQFAQTVTFDVANTLATPVETKASFTCLGKVTRDGKEFIGYRNEPTPSADKPTEPVLARTVLVDPATGLPVHNFVSETKADAPMLLSTVYSYPTDIAIEAPDAIPAGKNR